MQNQNVGAQNYGTYGGKKDDAAENATNDMIMPKPRKPGLITQARMEAFVSFKGVAEFLKVFGKTPILNVTAFIFLPWALFTVVTLPFALAWRRYPPICWTVLLISAAGSASLVWVSTRHKAYGRPPIYWLCLGGLCAAATLLAVPMGIYDYGKYTEVYYIYEESPVYANVLPSEDPGALQDAGMITFSGDAFVDSTLSIGHKAGRLYCVAPVLTSLAREQKLAGNGSLGLPTANFFAIGFDCCETGSFNCGPVYDKSVKGGLRFMDVSPMDRPQVPNFLSAAKQVGSTYNLTVPDNPLFIEWHRDSLNAQTAYWDSAVETYLLAVLTYLLVVIGSGMGGALVYDIYRRTVESQSLGG